MRNRTGFWELVTLALVVGAVALVIGCGGGVSQTDYDAVKQQLTNQEQKAAALQQQLSDKLREVTQLQQQVAGSGGDVTALREQLAAREKEAAALKQQLDAAKAVPGLPAGASVLLAAQPVPAPTPRPTPTPPPAGYVPPPAAVPPAAFYEPFKLIIEADTVVAAPGESKYNYDPTATGTKTPSCVATSIFKRGMRIVFRYEIVDMAIDKRLTNKEVENVAVRLPTGEEIKGRFGRHGRTEDAPWFWTSAWDIPLDYPLGVLDWSIQVSTKDGKGLTWKPYKTVSEAINFPPGRGVESRTQILE